MQLNSQIALSVKRAKQVMLEVDKNVGHLSSLAADPDKYGELIILLDPTVDKLEQHFVILQDCLAENLKMLALEFESTIKALSDISMMRGSKPPAHLSEKDKAQWLEFAASDVTLQQLAIFKNSLMREFINETSRQLKVESLNKQNIQIRKVLDNIRKLLVI